MFVLGGVSFRNHNQNPLPLTQTPVGLMILTGPFSQDAIGQKPQRSSEEFYKKPGCLEYIEEITTQLCRDYFINHDKDPYFSQPGFNGMS